MIQLEFDCVSGKICIWFLNSGHSGNFRSSWISVKQDFVKRLKSSQNSTKENKNEFSFLYQLLYFLKKF
ncbi:hypothetical protein FF021_00700 [Leptospira noguchii]|uniref:Uncharacterized protein n=2 Tax=Leptospira noguchii TaxID=28182 RepID=M6YLT2_9LEPT|nr:hypothetical protein LEP1GSC072_4110 [Leptospira noguchii str. Bonito]EMN01684.1 hypothetical protein LEP1GSC035_0234 [Leptospira noguchii str. 2007001578]EMO87293.1 hypothetical protein LEP1GSC024_0684 [Leptospira noguchii str. 2001034031]EMS83780.1 hypothetical protein LEP1GSC073_0352 [Leptospira noguchii str. Cascata]TQE83639.1 hypothetical protein FF021_00700 [Leptospira noguchii]